MDKDQLKTILVPSVFQIIVCLLLAIGIIAVVYSWALVDLVSHSSAITSDDLRASYQQQLAQLDQYQGLRTLVIGSAWAALGLIVYIVYIMISNIVILIRNEVVIDTNFVNTGGLVPHFRYFFTHSALVLVLIALMAATAYFGVPIWLNLFEIFVDQGMGYALVGIFAWLGLAANAFLVWTLAQLAIAYKYK